MALIYQDLIAEMAPFSSGAGTFFGQGEAQKILRWCQRLGGKTPQTSLFSNVRF